MRIWLLMVLVFTLILSLTVLAIVMTYRLAVKKGYEKNLRQLSQSGFSKQTAEALSLHGQRLLVVREESAEILFQEDEGLPPGLSPVPERFRVNARMSAQNDAETLAGAVEGGRAAGPGRTHQMNGRSPEASAPEEKHGRDSLLTLAKRRSPLELRRFGVSERPVPVLLSALKE